MCRWAAIAIAALCAAPSGTSARVSGTDLRQLCSASPQECLGYVRAVADLVAQSGCPSRTEVEAIATVLHYMKEHPDELGNDAVSLVHLALEEAFDCKRRPLGLWDALGD